MCYIPSHGRRSSAQHFFIFFSPLSSSVFPPFLAILAYLVAECYPHLQWLPLEHCTSSSPQFHQLVACQSASMADFRKSISCHIAPKWIFNLADVRGLVHEHSLHNPLKFLDIPHKQLSSFVQDSVCASVEALAFMCRLRFSPSLKNRSFDTDDPQSYLIMHAADQRSGRKRKAISNEKSLISTFKRRSKILPSNRC